MEDDMDLVRIGYREGRISYEAAMIALIDFGMGYVEADRYLEAVS
jgi:hypothetical protein